MTGARIRRGLFALLVFAAAKAAIAQLTVRLATPEEAREYRRVEQILTTWAEAVRKRHGLDSAHCSMGARVACRFGLDGADLALLNADHLGRAASLAYFELGNRFQIVGRRLEIVGGTWIRVGDLFEFKVGRRIYPYFCEEMGEPPNSIAQCRTAYEFAQIADRASLPPSRYELDAPLENAAIAKALAKGSLVIRHNGRSLDWRPFFGAARDFERQDFARLVSR